MEKKDTPSMTDIWAQEKKSTYGSEEPRQYEAQPSAAQGRPYKKEFDPSAPQEFDSAKQANFNSPEVEQQYEVGYGNSFELGSDQVHPDRPDEIIERPGDRPMESRV